MTESLLKIGVTLLLLLLVLKAISRLGRRFQWPAEVQRKTVHTGLGLYVLSFPFLFSELWEVGVICGSALAIFALMRSIPGLHRELGSGLYAVDRQSLGELMFAVSIFLLFMLSGDRKILFILPMMILTLCDAAAALVGTAYGRSTFVIERGRKSWEGTAFFFLTAWLLSLIALLLLTGIDRTDTIWFALAIAAFGALIEAASWKGLDNLFIPVGLFIFMERMLALDPGVFVAMSASLLVILPTVALAAPATGRSRHVMITMATVVFFFLMVKGWANALAPAGLFALYLALTARQPRDDDGDLAMILAVIALGLFWYVASQALHHDFHFGLHLALGSLATLLIGQMPHRYPMGGIALATGVGWTIGCLRILSTDALSARSWILSGIALLVLLGVAIGTVALNRLSRPIDWTPPIAWANRAFLAAGASIIGVVAATLLVDWA